MMGVAKHRPPYIKHAMEIGSLPLTSPLKFSTSLQQTGGQEETGILLS